MRSMGPVLGEGGGGRAAPAGSTAARDEACSWRGARAADTTSPGLSRL
jgi:hypothetical protein